MRPNAQDLLDAWGRPFVYGHDKERFILVGLGRDGLPDGSDYWEVRDTCLFRSAQDIACARICGNPDADTLLSDRGRHRLCGK